MARPPASRKAPSKSTRNEEPFKGKPHKEADFALLGANADKCVKFEPEGLRITLPADKSRGPTGVTTAFGVGGDFEITIRYELLAQSSGSSISVTANLNQPVVTDELNRPVVKAASVSCIKGGGIVIPRNAPAPPGLGSSPRALQIFTMRKDAARITDRSAAAFAVNEKSGQFRLVRTGENLAYYLADGLEQDFQWVTTHPFAADDLKDLQIFAKTSSPQAALDVRFTDLRMRAALVPKTLESRPALLLPAPPPRDLAERVEYRFGEGFDEKPEVRRFGPEAKAVLQVDEQGLRATVPDARKGNGPVGVETPAAATGRFRDHLQLRVARRLRARTTARRRC
jgi:hypothetical protein